MSVFAQPLAAGLFVLAVAGCASTPTDEPRRAPAETITGSNIPRYPGAPRRETNVLTDDAVQELINAKGPRGKPSP